MEPIYFVAPWYYTTVYYALFLLLSWMTVLYYMGSNQQKILHSEGSPMQAVALLLTIVLIYFIGLRPVSKFFGDSLAYKISFDLAEGYMPVSASDEWVLHNLMVYCKYSGLNIIDFGLIVAHVYYYGMFICSLILVRKNLWIAVIFFYISFSCYSYGVNGIRNGMACSIELVAIALITKGGASRVIAFLLMFLALGTHRSTMLPTAAALASTFIFKKDTKTVLRFWVASIFISLAAGPLVTSFFASLGFDDRMSSYSSGAEDEQAMSQFSQVGFRWDFLFYSMFPVIFTWYLTQYRKFKDQTFNIIANTYILCNSFWIMVIRSAFSNRFAYLSWFIYPIVMVYPLLRMNIWKDQDRKTALITFFYTGFTFFMFFIFYFGTMSGFRGLNQFWWK